MLKTLLLCMLCVLLMLARGQSPSSIQPGVPGYSYHPPQEEKESWQRLYLLLSSTFINVVNEGQIDLDSSLYMASRSLGLSPFSILAEGIDNPDLFSRSRWIDKREPATGMSLLSNAKDREHLELLILLGSYYAFQPRTYQGSWDSAAYFLTRAVNEGKSLKEEKLKRQALCLLGKIYVQISHSKTDSLYESLINECRKAGDKRTEARALAYRSRYTAPTVATLQSKIDDSRKAVDLYRILRDIEGEINALTDIGYLLTVTGQLQPAKDTFLKALELAEAIHFPYTHYNAQALSMITTFQGKFGEPLRYTLQTIKIAESCRDSIGWGYFHNNLALLLKAEGRRKEGLEITQRAIKRFIIDRNPSVYNLLIDVINDMDEAGQAKEALELTMNISKDVNEPRTFTDQFFYHYALAVCYLNLNRLNVAETHIIKMDSLETMAEAIRGPLRRSAIHSLRAVVSFKRGRYREAKEYFEKHFITPSVGMRDLTNDLSTYRWLIIVDSALGDNLSMVSHYKKYAQLIDSNFKVTKVRQAEELQVLYQIQEKEHEIAMLTKQTKLEKANSDQATLVKNLTFAGAFGVVIISGLLYRQNRLRRKSNEVITRKNKQLEDLLGSQDRLIKDKEWLLKEIHHRVKNNLQIVMSLLNSQSVYINNDAALTAIHDSQRRMHAMALIHQRLYQSENISAIVMPEYINELVSYVQDSFDAGNRIAFEQTIDLVDLDVSQAIPLGLIINESIVNALKYAFPGGRKGVVSIRLSYEGDDHLLLEVSDNGVGLPSDRIIEQHNSLGLDLMRGLTKQLNGRFSIESNKGLHIAVRFGILNKQFSDNGLISFKR
jgi:two-component system, sensor histidine kinase PdtaS